MTSSVLRWPDARTVSRAVRAWAKKYAEKRKDIKQIGYFGSYARGNWGVGSDVDIVVLLERSDKPFIYRASDVDITTLPVPADVLVYTQEEWDRLCSTSDFYQKIIKEIIWVYSE